MRLYGLILLILFSVSPAWAGSYKCKDSNGAVTFQQMPCPVTNSGIRPLAVEQVSQAVVEKTLNHFREALSSQDKRAQLSLLADDFELSVYDSRAFDYVRSRYLKSELLGPQQPQQYFFASHVPLTAELLDGAATANQAWVLLYSKSGTDTAALARVQLCIRDGHLLIRRWDAIRPGTTTTTASML